MKAFIFILIFLHLVSSAFAEDTYFTGTTTTTSPPREPKAFDTVVTISKKDNETIYFWEVLLKRTPKGKTAHYVWDKKREFRIKKRSSWQNDLTFLDLKSAVLTHASEGKVVQKATLLTIKNTLNFILEQRGSSLTIDFQITYKDKLILKDFSNLSKSTSTDLRKIKETLLLKRGKP